MSLKYNFSGIDGAASASTAELNYALKDLSIAVGPTDEAGSKGGNVEFEWKVEEGESSGDVFDFKAGEPTTAEETYYEIKMEDALISSWSSGASETGYNDGVVDAADYVVWRKADGAPVDIDLSFSAADTGGIPVSMGEYGLLLL